MDVDNTLQVYTTQLENIYHTKRKKIHRNCQKIDKICGTNNAIFVKIVKSAKFVKSWKICKNLIF